MQKWLPLYDMDVGRYIIHRSVELLKHAAQNVKILLLLHCIRWFIASNAWSLITTGVLFNKLRFQIDEMQWRWLGSKDTISKTDRKCYRSFGLFFMAFSARLRVHYLSISWMLMNNFNGHLNIHLHTKCTLSFYCVHIRLTGWPIISGA